MRFTLSFDPGRGLFERGFGNVIHNSFGWIALHSKVTGIIDPSDGFIDWSDVPVPHAITQIGRFIIIQGPRETALVGMVCVVVVRFVLTNVNDE